MTSVVLLLGGNMGDVEQTFRGVCADLERLVGSIESCSKVFKSASWGFQAAEFSNQAVIVSTDLDAEVLLDTTQAIEERWGRAREAELRAKKLSGERYNSRTIDIDIIFYGDSVIESDRLVVPHPLMDVREFVLEPIAQIAPEATHPKNGKSVAQMLYELKVG